MFLSLRHLTELNAFVRIAVISASGGGGDGGSNLIHQQPVLAYINAA